MDVLVNLDQCLLVQLLVFDVDLNEEFPFLLLLSKVYCVFSCHILLSANFNGGFHVEDWLGVVIDREELLDFSLLVLLHVAIEQQRCVVLVVISYRR